MSGHIEVSIDRLVIDRLAASGLAASGWGVADPGATDLPPGDGPDSPTAALLEAALARELHRVLASPGAQGSVLPAPRTGEDVRKLVAEALRRVLATRTGGNGDGHG